MKQYAQQVRTQLLTLIMAGVAGAGVATAATAAGIGGGVHADVGAGASVPAPDTDTAQTGGVANAHMSTSGSANSNAQWQSGATRGADRATERMNANSAGLEAAGTATVNGKRKR